jgi:dTDP-4-dehydrorhamnose reductase
MAGHVIAAYLEEKSYDVYITSRSAEDGEKSKPIDAADFASLEAWLKHIAPDVIINCIGVLPKEADAYPDIAILLNACLPQRLSRIFRDTKTKIIHLSTDCVFSGKRGRYTEKDDPDGTTIYDRSKALGEIVNGKDLTFRMSIIGPDRHEQGVGLFNWFMAQTGEIRGYTQAIWNGGDHDTPCPGN